MIIKGFGLIRIVLDQSEYLWIISNSYERFQYNANGSKNFQNNTNYYWKSQSNKNGSKKSRKTPNVIP